MKSRTVYTSTKSEIPKADDGSIRYKIDKKKYPLKAHMITTPYKQ